MYQPLITTERERHEASTASESTRKHVFKQNGLVKILDKQFTNTAKEGLSRARKHFKSQTLEERILAGNFNAGSIGKSKSGADSSQMSMD